MISKEELERFLLGQVAEAEEARNQNADAAREIRGFCAARRIQGLWREAAVLRELEATRHQGRLDTIKNIREFFGLTAEETVR